MTLNTYLNRFRSMWNVWTVQCSGTPGTFRRHCSQSLMYSDETAWCPQWKIPPENRWKNHFKTQNFTMSLDALTIKNLCLWCEFQGRLLLIISLFLKTFWQPCIACTHYTLVMRNKASCLLRLEGLQGLQLYMLTTNPSSASFYGNILFFY